MSSSKEKEETKEKGGEEEKMEAGKEEMTAEPSLAQSTRSERKRNREQKRRNEVNGGLDQLTRLIFMIDPQLKVVAELRASKNHSGGKRPPGVSDAQLLSRVELINSAVATLARVHQENEERKLMIARLTMGATGNGGANPLMGSAAGSMLGAANLMAAGSPLRMQNNPMQMGESGEQASKTTKEKTPEDETKEGGPVTKRLKKRQEK